MTSRANMTSNLSTRLQRWWSTQTRWATKEAFADEVGIGYTSVKDYFNGQAVPGDPNARKLSAATGIGDGIMDEGQMQLTQDSPDVGDSAPEGTPSGGAESSPGGRDAEEDRDAPPVSQGRMTPTGEVDPELRKTLRIAVSGDVSLRQLELDLIDTRVFQRLHSIK